MDCSAFHRHHVAFVDDTLPGDLLVAAARHAAECAECARHDAAVRRSLLVARNVCGRAELECSPDFAARLEARLRRGDGLGDTVGLPTDGWVGAPRWGGWDVTAPLARLATPRRTRQALAAAAMLAAASTGALLRGSTAPMQVQGLGSGPLASVTFGSPFAPLLVDRDGLGASPVSVGSLDGNGDFVVHPGTEPTDLGRAELVVYEGSVDASALVAPAAVGVPVWPAAVLAGEVPAVLWRGGEAAIELGRVSH